MVQRSENRMRFARWCGPFDGFAMSEARAKAPPASWRGRGPRRLTSAIGLMLLKRARMRARILKIENKSLKAVNKAWKMYGKAMSAMMNDLGSETTTSREAPNVSARLSSAGVALAERTSVQHRS